MKLGYDTGKRALLSPEAVGLSGESAGAIKRIELLSEDPEQFLRVVFAQPKSLTAKVRNDLVRVLGKSNLDHLLILASDFDTLEFVFLDKRKREQKGPAGGERIQVVPKTISVNRRSPTRLDLRTLRRFTWTCRDALEQFDKLRSVFDAAAYTGEYFQNRGLFSDYFLRDRLREDPAWRDNPSEIFAFVRDLAAGRPELAGAARTRTRCGISCSNRSSRSSASRPRSTGPARPTRPSPTTSSSSGDGSKLTAAFVYAWDRWLDGPDLNDADTPDENPGACVVTALDAGIADWIIVTNGRLWRLYSRQAHARATNFYEVDLVEALTASGDTDPNEAFRYWWLFLRPAALRSHPTLEGRGASRRREGCWLDDILLGSREYAKRLGERLKDRIFLTIFPHLAQGFLADRKQRLGQSKQPTEEELADIFEATLTLLYRLLFLLYAESRDLLPIREAPYHAASLKKIKDEIADKAGVAESDVAERLDKAYSAKDTTLYDRLVQAVPGDGQGRPHPERADLQRRPVQHHPLPVRERGRGEGIAATSASPAFSLEHKVPDRYLALAIDRLARDQDEQTLALVFIDYKSLEVRHLGSIYEGLLEFKLKVADEDLTTQADKKGETYIPLSQGQGEPPAQAGRGRRAQKGQSTSPTTRPSARRRVRTTRRTPSSSTSSPTQSGPVLEEKLEALRGEFRKVRKTFDNELQKSQAYPEQGGQERQDGPPAVGRAANVQRPQRPGGKPLRPASARPGDGQRPLPGRDGRFRHRRLAQVPQPVPDQPGELRPGSDPREHPGIPGRAGRHGRSGQADRHQPAQAARPQALHLRRRSQPDGRGAGEGQPVARCLHAGGAAQLPRPPPALWQLARSGRRSRNWKRRLPTLFALNYEPLMQAINHVLFVSKMADATAAEVAASVSRYDQARQLLAGYQIVLDLLVAEHFGLSGRRRIWCSMVRHLDLTDRERFYASLQDDRRAETGRPGRGAGPAPRPSLLPLGDRVPRSLLRLHRRQRAADQAQGSDCKKVRRGSTAWWGIHLTDLWPMT